jgi:hypothetical protein
VTVNELLGLVYGGLIIGAAQVNSPDEMAVVTNNVQPTEAALTCPCPFRIPRGDKSQSNGS